MSVIDFISDWSGKVFSFLAVIVVGVISYEVIARYAFNAPTIWAHETMTYLCGFYYIMGGAYTFYFKGHVSVDVLYVRLSPRVQAIVDLITFPLFFIYLGVLIWTGADYGWESVVFRETSPTAWAPPVYPLKLSIPVGACLVLLQGLAKFVRDFNIAIGRKKQPLAQ